MASAVDDRLPDFVVIGAMKCATTTLHEQLARQPGVFMSRPKEPNFFSDDGVFARGVGWYASLFRGAEEGDLCGESSTHYTKLPTYPDAVARAARTLPRAKLVYVMRHPIDRLLSHYVHELTNGRITVGLREAVGLYPELVDYGRYAVQLTPWLDAYGPDHVLPVFFRRLAHQPQAELERIGRFLGLPTRPTWDTALEPQNVGSQRLRCSAVRDALARAPVLTPLRRRVIPKGWTEPIKSLWRSNAEPPEVPADLRDDLRGLFDEDLARLGQWLGVRLDCANFRDLTGAAALDWAGR